MAVLETLVALAVILGFARKVSYIAAAAFSVVIWAAGEGFGGPYGSGSSDIGTAIIYALVFVCLLTLAAYTGTDRYSVNYYLEQKISWGWKVAEVGHLVRSYGQFGRAGRSGSAAGPVIPVARHPAPHRRGRAPRRSASPPARQEPTGTCARSPGTHRKE